MVKKIKVLIVDDDEALTETLADIMDTEGHKTFRAARGEEAIEMVKKDFFDVVLMDVKMPGMNGVEAFKRIKIISPKSVVIIMTGYSLTDLIEEALKEGVHSVIYKPIDIDNLLKTIDTIKGGGGLIMIVDNDEDSTLTLKSALEKTGYDVNWAKDGMSAIEQQKKQSRDIVFIELSMPILNGLEVFEELKKISPSVIAIMMSFDKFANQELIRRALDENAYACLYKPFDPEEAINIIKEVKSKKLSTE